MTLDSDSKNSNPIFDMVSPWYICTGWLAVKHQFTYLLTLTWHSQSHSPWCTTKPNLVMKRSAVQKISSGKSPVQKIPSGKSPVQKISSGKSPVQKIPSGKSPVQKIPSGKPPVQKIPSGKSPVQKISSRQSQDTQPGRHTDRAISIYPPTPTSFLGYNYTNNNTALASLTKISIPGRSAYLFTTSSITLPQDSRWQMDKASNVTFGNQLVACL